MAVHDTFSKLFGRGCVEATSSDDRVTQMTSTHLYTREENCDLEKQIFAHHHDIEQQTAEHLSTTSPRIPGQTDRLLKVFLLCIVGNGHLIITEFARSERHDSVSSLLIYNVG